MKQLSPCSCSGEVFLDYFDPVARPVEYFTRCRRCGGLGPVAATEAEAIARWEANPAATNPAAAA